MSVEFIGMIGTQHASEIHPPTGPVVDPDYTRRFARAHEDAGFDRILIGYGSGWPEGTQVAAHVAAHTERLGLLVAHRPGFVAPTLAARTFATLDQFSGGRVAVHMITGGNDAEQRRDGDYLDKDERYARTDEYLDDPAPGVGRPTEPFDHDGRALPVRGLRLRTCSRSGRIPLYFGGSSEAAYRVGGKHADTFALWGEPLAETAEQIAAVRAAAIAAGRTDAPGISVSFRPDPRPDRGARLGAGAPRSWTRSPAATAGRARACGRSGRRAGERRLAAAARGGGQGRPARPGAVDRDGEGDRGGRQLDRAGRHARDGRRRRCSTTSTSASTTLLIRGYDPLDDAIDYGRHLLPLVRDELARREAATSAKAADLVSAGASSVTVTATHTGVTAAALARAAAGRVWDPAAGVAVRGTVVVLPGRGEHAGVYERFGRRLAFDGYAVRALDDAERRRSCRSDAQCPVSGRDQADRARRCRTPERLRALAIAAAGSLPIDGLLLAGALAEPGGTHSTSRGHATWDDELDARTACPVHRARLGRDTTLVRGALARAVPVEVLDALHRLRTARHRGSGAARARRGRRDRAGRGARARWPAALPRAEIAIVHGGRHDVLNDAHHRTVAAQVVQWLERLRADAATAAPILTVS